MRLNQKLVFFILPFALNSCSEEKKQQKAPAQNAPVANNVTPAAPAIPVVKGIDAKTLVGKWKLDGVVNTTKGDTVRKDAHYHFKDDCSFIVDKNKEITTGSWSLSANNDTLTLLREDGKKEEFTGIVVTGDNGILNKGDKKFLVSREK